MKSTQHPKDMELNFIDDWEDKFGIKEVSNPIKEVSGMVCKIVDDELQILGHISDSTFDDCGVCGDFLKE
jgi:hypothetical protein